FLGFGLLIQTGQIGRQVGFRTVLIQIFHLVAATEATVQHQAVGEVFDESVLAFLCQLEPVEVEKLAEGCCRVGVACDDFAHAASFRSSASTTRRSHDDREGSSAFARVSIALAMVAGMTMPTVMVRSVRSRSRSRSCTGVS